MIYLTKFILLAVLGMAAPIDTASDGQEYEEMSNQYPGVIAGVHLNTGLRYGYEGGVAHDYNVSPWCGGYTVANNLAFPHIDSSSTPPAMRASTVAFTEIHLPLPFGSGNDTDAPEAVYSFSSITIDYSRLAAGDQATVEIRRKAKVGFGAAATVLGWNEATDFTTMGSVWTTYSDTASAHDFDFIDYNYFIYVKVSPTVGVTDMKLGDIELQVLKKAVE